MSESKSFCQLILPLPAQNLAVQASKSSSHTLCKDKGPAAPHLIVQESTPIALPTCTPSTCTVIEKELGAPVLEG